MKKIFLLLTLLVFISCSKSNISNETVVGIVPYEGLSSKKIKNICNVVETYYGVTTKILPEVKLPRRAFINIKSARYRADSLIAIQQRSMPNNVNYIIGLTESDISTTKHDDNGSIKKPEWRYNDFGIMGLAYCPGKSCVVSDFRLKHKNKEIQFGRFKKVVIHELGHNFGLPHCPDKKCVMTDAIESIETIDNAKPELCHACKNKIL